MGGDATINADLARRVLAGEHGPHRDIVSLNAGAGLVVAGLADDLPAGIEAAREAIDSGAAVAALAALVEVCQREAAAETGVRLRSRQAEQQRMVTPGWRSPTTLATALDNSG